MTRNHDVGVAAADMEIGPECVPGYKVQLGIADARKLGLQCVDILRPRTRSHGGLRESLYDRLSADALH